MAVIGKGAARAQGPITVKRILKQGQHYLCGICQKRYELKRDALSCLKRCSQNYLNRTSPDEVQEKGLKRYRCHYCKRIYAERSEAEDCVRVCRGLADKRLKLEKKFQERHLPPEKLRILQALSGGNSKVIEALQNAGKNKSPSTPTACSHCGEMYPSKEAAAICKSRHEARGETDLQKIVPQQATKSKKTKPSSQPQPDRPAKVEIPASVQELAKPNTHIAENNATWEEHDDGGLSAKQLEYLEKAKKIKVKKDSDKFIRDGARYVCRVCSNKFFTRVEVIQCFDDHLNPNAASQKSSHESEAPTQEFGEIAKASMDIPVLSEQDLENRQNRPDEEKFIRDGAKYVCNACQKKFFERKEAIACFNRGCVEVVPSKDEEAEAESFEERVAKGILFRVDHSEDHKFYRNGSKYVCRACKKSHFTKDEATSCYDSHK